MIDESRTSAVLSEDEATALVALLLGSEAAAAASKTGRGRPTTPLFGASPATPKVASPVPAGSLFGGVIDLRQESSAPRTEPTVPLFGPPKPTAPAPRGLGPLFPPSEAEPKPLSLDQLPTLNLAAAPRPDTVELDAARLALPADAQPVGFVAVDPALEVEAERRRGRGRLLTAFGAISALVIGGVAVSAMSGTGEVDTRTDANSTAVTVPTSVATTVLVTTTILPETTLPPETVPAETAVPLVESTVPAVTAAAPAPAPTRPPTTVRRRSPTTTAPATSATTTPETSATFAPPTWTAPPTSTPVVPPAPTTTAPPQTTTAPPATSPPSTSPPSTSPPTSTPPTSPAPPPSEASAGNAPSSD